MSRPSPPRSVIAVDGATGAGKTTLASQLTTQLHRLGRKVLVLPLDELCHGWDDLAGGLRRGGELTARFVSSGRLQYQPFDWETADTTDVTLDNQLPVVNRCGDVLIVEGCGAASDEFARHAGTNLAQIAATRISDTGVGRAATPDVIETIPVCSAPVPSAVVEDTKNLQLPELIWDAVILLKASEELRHTRITARDTYDWTQHRAPWQAQHDALSYRLLDTRPVGVWISTATGSTRN